MGQTLKRIKKIVRSGLSHSTGSFASFKVNGIPPMILIGISETSRCLADAMQAATGCTLGHGNAFVENATEFSELMSKWMMRLGKLNPKEEEELSIQLLNLDEK